MIKGLMRCWHCHKEMVWGGDFSFEDYGRDGEGIVSNFSCQTKGCPTTAEVWYDIAGEED